MNERYPDCAKARQCQSTKPCPCHGYQFDRSGMLNKVLNSTEQPFGGVAAKLVGFGVESP